MVIIIEGISDKALVRLSKNKISERVAWAGIRENGETDICLADNRYSLYTGSLFDKRDYVEIKHEEYAFVIMSGEFNRVIVE